MPVRHTLAAHGKVPPPLGGGALVTSPAHRSADAADSLLYLHLFSPFPHFVTASVVPGAAAKGSKAKKKTTKAAKTIKKKKKTNGTAAPAAGNAPIFGDDDDDIFK